MGNFKLRGTIGMRILKLLPNQVINSMEADVIEYFKFNVDRILEECIPKDISVTDEEINIATIENMSQTEGFGIISQAYFRKGAKWLRDKLKRTV